MLCLFLLRSIAKVKNIINLLFVGLLWICSIDAYESLHDIELTHLENVISDGENQLLVTQRVNDYDIVFYYIKNGKIVHQWEVLQGKGPGEIMDNSPVIKVDWHHGRVYISDNNLTKIVQYSLSGNYVDDLMFSTAIGDFFMYKDRWVIQNGTLLGYDFIEIKNNQVVEEFGRYNKALKHIDKLIGQRIYMKSILLHDTLYYICGEEIALTAINLNTKKQESYNLNQILKKEKIKLSPYIKVKKADYKATRFWYEDMYQLKEQLWICLYGPDTQSHFLVYDSNIKKFSLIIVNKTNVKPLMINSEIHYVYLDENRLKFERIE